jgi:putative ABC transport system substrate-binding protein
LGALDVVSERPVMDHKPDEYWETLLLDMPLDARQDVIAIFPLEGANSAPPRFTTSGLPRSKPMLGIRRREFITLLGAAAAWPLAAHAQQPRKPIIGVLNPGLPGSLIVTDRVAALRQGLRENGYVEGGNVAIEYRYSEGHNDRFPALVSDLVRHQVSLIVAFGIPAALAARAAGTTTPIVFTMGGDPVKLGLIAALNRPGGNLTGATSLSIEVGAKRVQLLHDIVPGATSIALLVNPTSPIAETEWTDVQAAARTLGLQSQLMRASAEPELDAIFASLARLRTGGLVIGNDGFFNPRAEHLGALATRHAVPTIFQYREFAAAGGLASYGDTPTDSIRVVSTYAGRILKGEKPADLPVQQASKVELVINMKTANRLGLAVPLTVRALATELIE